MMRSIGKFAAQWGPAIVVAVLFTGSGTVETLFWRDSVEQFAAWGYPSYWPLVTGILKSIGGLLTLLPATRSAGLLLCSAIALAAFGTVLWFHELPLMVPSGLGTFVTLSITYWYLSLRS